MRRALALLLVASLLLAPLSAGDHTEASQIRCDGGFCQDGEDHLVDCSGERCTGSQRGFPTIVNPAFAEDNPRLDPDERVLATEIEGQALAYPIEVMRWFETVEDEIDGTPILATYCPLCAAGVVFERRLDGETLTLYNSGEIWKNDLVLYEAETNSRFSQVLGEAIQGPLHGEALPLLASTITTWGDWQETHPDTLVLQHPVDEDGHPMADYDADPYASYRHIRDTPQGHPEDAGLDMHPKTPVVGIEDEDHALAIPKPVVREQGPIVAEVGSLSVVAGWQGGGVHVYETGERSFDAAGPGQIVDDTGTTWWIGNGTSRDGEQLTRVPATNAFWFAWLDTRPETDVITASDPPSRQQADPEPASPIPAPGPLAVLALLALAGLAGRRGEG